MKTIEQVKKEINNKLEENGLLIPAFSLARHFIKTYKDEDWKAYEKETGNPRLDFVPPKNGLEAMIDEATGYNKEQTLAAGLFLLWNILEFEKGFKKGFEK
jgi:hypothetical protein